MGVSCQIYIEKPREGVHRAGQTVIGILRYAIDKPTEYQTATLSLIGKAKCKWITESNDFLLIHCHAGHEIFLSMHLNIRNKRPEETVTLPVGAYEFRFQFTLPFEIPSSFKDEYSEIDYHLVAKFENPSFFSWNRKFDRKITVYGNFNPTVPIEPVSYKIRKGLFKMFSNEEYVIVIHAQLNKSFLMPGENAKVQLTVTNDTFKEINYVSINLLSKTSYHSTSPHFGPKTKVVEKKYPCVVMTPSVPQNKISKFTCIVPILPEVYTLEHCKIIKKEFFLRVKASSSFPDRNPSVNIPIVIGEGRFEDCCGIIELDNFDETNDGPVMADSPTYWEAEGQSEEESDE